MNTVDVSDGDTWQSIATANGVPLTSLWMANGIDPSSNPDPPQVGSSVALPDDPAEAAAAPGHEHTLDTPEESTLWIRLNLTPDAASAEPGSLRLYSSDGACDVTRAIATSFVANSETVDILFDSVDSNGTFSVDYVDSSGASVNVVQDVPFAQLQDGDAAGAPASSPSPPNSDGS